MEFSQEQIAYMRKALTLAERARGFTAPNPLVGAVIVKDNKIVGEGCHEIAGGPHAEVNALSAARAAAMGATMYVTLEPCAHYGKTPPCANALVRAGIKEVFIALTDPNPLVNGKGIAILEEAGITVHRGLLREEACRQNEIFLVNQTQKRAYIALKSAQTLDAKIGPADGRPLAITGEESRRYSHELRRRYGAVLVGINTILKDDPVLTIRYGIDHLIDSPVRVILDPQLKMPVNARILNREDGPILIYTASEVSGVFRKKIEDKGGHICFLPGKGNRIDLHALAADLYQRGVCGVLAEGGADTLSRFFKAKLWDSYHCFIAPKFLGGDGISVFSGELPAMLNLDAEVETKVFGSDAVIEYRNRSEVKSCLPE